MKAQTNPQNVHNDIETVCKLADLADRVENLERLCEQLARSSQLHAKLKEIEPRGLSHFSEP